MKNYYKKMTSFMLLVIGMCMISFQSNSQVVNVPTGAILSDVINGDTTAIGERNDVNAIYELEMNGIYEVAAALSINSKLHIRAAEGEGFLPLVIAKKDANDSWPQLINNSGDITLERLQLSNANGADANPKWGGFRAAGENSTVVLDGCLIEYDKACALQLRADGIDVTIENCVASKSGNYKEYNGNGRLIDTRGFKTASIVVKNTTIYYMQDRIIRNMGGEIDYLEFDHVTVVNNQGFHGCFAMAKVHEAKITNNLVINGMYGGDHPNVNEQTSSNAEDNLQIYMITMDTVFADSKLTISNNNIAFTQPVLDFFATIDSISKPAVLAPTVAAFLGDAAADAYFEEAVTFTSMPDVPWDFLTSIYMTPNAEQHPDNWPDLIGISNIDASYPMSSVSATASTTGGPIGDLNWMGGVGIFDNQASINTLNVNVYPNPMSTQATFAYQLEEASNVELTIFDIAGKEVKNIQAANQAEGSYTMNLDASNLTDGMYLYTLKSNNATTSGKITIRK